MTTYQSLEAQLRALEKLKNYLEVFTEELQENLDRYHRSVEEIRQDGLANEVYNTYLSQNFYRDKSHIDQLINDIETYDIPYLFNNIEKATASLDAARF